MVREGNTKAFGHIKEIYPMNAPPTDLEDNFTANDLKAPNNKQAIQIKPEKKNAD